MKPNFCSTPSAITQHTTKLVPGGSYHLPPHPPHPKTHSRTRRRWDLQGYTYKVILDFLKLDPQLLELCRQELWEVQAAGLGGWATGRQGAGSQEQQGQGWWAGLHAARGEAWSSSRLNFTEGETKQICSLHLDGAPNLYSQNITPFPFPISWRAILGF